MPAQNLTMILGTGGGACLLVIILYLVFCGVTGTFKGPRIPDALRQSSSASGTQGFSSEPDAQDFSSPSVASAGLQRSSPPSSFNGYRLEDHAEQQGDQRVITGTLTNTTNMTVSGWIEYGFFSKDHQSLGTVKLDISTLRPNASTVFILTVPYNDAVEYADVGSSLTVSQPSTR